jgi:glutamine---fructose-6-phosphate transaminase (isomerizing)
MCGLFGIISPGSTNLTKLKTLVKSARQRGRDSSGFVYHSDGNYHVAKADYDINRLSKEIRLNNASIILGHSRLITNGLSDNQPILREDIVLLHNGIIVNENDVWQKTGLRPQYQIDSETIIAAAHKGLISGLTLENLSDFILETCQGVMACAMLFPKLGKLMLFSNNGSLYCSKLENAFYFSSEKFPLLKIGAENPKQIINDAMIIDIPKSDTDISISETKSQRQNLIPEFAYNNSEVKLLEYESHQLVRCSKCILPETMPFIYFDENGICNYCHNYKIRNNPKPKTELFSLVEKYRRNGESDCIVPFSGGRDSCYGLHLIVNELKMKPITYTYDWGMVTDLGRRNISRMCAQLGVENIIIADDIAKKRHNIKMNLNAWLRSPHLGMIAMLTAGDKHFFRHVKTVQKQTGIDLQLWGVNPLEATHFKTGFLGIAPDFEESRVYSSGAMKQLRYHAKRTRAMMQSPGYFNSSLWDTLSGEYHRSFASKSDYFHLFDYWKWDEKIVNQTLIGQYDWEKAVDTSTTWRIGDGTAAIYNYIYYLAAGFTEHDTFRSNQIREGQITREEALILVEDENQPRYENIRWYLDTLGMDFSDVIKRINNMEKQF